MFLSRIKETEKHHPYWQDRLDVTQANRFKAGQNELLSLGIDRIVVTGANF